jgi:MFS transporter, SHS family, lactate transporter
MTIINDWRSLTTVQRNTFLAGLLGWTCDAFDFFVLVFILRPLAEEFGASIRDLTLAIVLTLAARPIGALIFGRLADRYGRRPVLMLNFVTPDTGQFICAPSSAAPTSRLTNW